MSIDNFLHIGKSPERVEDARLLIGNGRFIDDINLPGMVHVAFARSPFAAADIQSINIEEAVHLQGVKDVLVHDRLPDKMPPYRGDLLSDGWQGCNYELLARDEVRFAGEAVAAVAAESRYLAEDAAARIEVDYEPRDAVVNVDQALQEGTTPLHEGWQSNLFFVSSMSAGDCESAFASSDEHLSLTIRNARQSAMPLETRGNVADYNPRDGSLTVWAPIQMPYLLRTFLADTLDFPESRIRVIVPDVGGSFGSKADIYPETIVVCLFALRLGGPVKWIEDRREHLLAGSHSRDHTHEVEVAYRADGRIMGLRAKIYVDCGAYSLFPGTAARDAGMAMRALPGPYRIQNYEAKAFSVATNKSPMGSYRGVGRPAACLSIERVLDQIARATSIDPVEIRRRNLISSADLPCETASGYRLDSGSFGESLDKLCEVADYEDMLKDQRAARDEGRLLGIGVACFTEQTAHGASEFASRGMPVVPGYEAAEIRLDPSGTAIVQVTTNSQGQSHRTTIAQIVAEVLTLGINDVDVRFGDTDVGPYGWGTFASRTAVLAGGAVWRAAEQIENKLLVIGAHLMDAEISNVELAEGTVHVKDENRNLSIADIARTVFHHPENLPAGIAPVLQAWSTYDAAPGTGAFSNSAQLALVEVDPETGATVILRYVAVEDCGTMINPMVVEGQMVGGIAQGIGGALLEEIPYSPDGQPLATTLLDYLLPSATDMPFIEVEHLSTPSPLTIAGLKGVGETGTIAVGATLAGAIENALEPLGVGILTDLPLTSLRIWSALEDASKSRREKEEQEKSRRSFPARGRSSRTFVTRYLGGSR